MPIHAGRKYSSCAWTCWTRSRLPRVPAKARRALRTEGCRMSAGRALRAWPARLLSINPPARRFLPDIAFLQSILGQRLQKRLLARPAESRVPRISLRRPLRVLIRVRRPRRLCPPIDALTRIWRSIIIFEPRNARFSPIPAFVQQPLQNQPRG